MRRNVTKTYALTTGQLAAVFCVAPRTIAKWFEDGLFPNGYKLPRKLADSKTITGRPKGEDRRIPVQDVLEFSHAHGMPIHPAFVVRLRVVFAGFDVVPQRWYDQSPAEREGVEADAKDLIGAAVGMPRGNEIAQFVISESVPRNDAVRFCAHVPAYQPRPVVLVSEDSPESPENRRLYHRNLDYLGIARNLKSHVRVIPELLGAVLPYKFGRDHDRDKGGTVAGRVGGGEEEPGGDRGN